MTDKIIGKSDKDADMLLDEIKFFLEQQGKTMLELAERLSHKGATLNPEQKELLRVALATRVKRYSAVLLSNFVLGDIAEMERCADEIFTYAQFCDKA